MNTKLLNDYKNIVLPYNSTYRKESNSKELFRKYDSPLAYLDLDKEKQLTLLNWCESLNRIKKINLSHSSYGMKHIFGREEDGFYIYNGAFKGAMLLAGFNVHDVEDLNWTFNISEKSINDILKNQRKGVLHQ